MDAAVHAYSMVSVPLYDTLGPDAVEYICNHAELACVGCSAAVLPVLMGCLERCKTVRVLVGGVGGEYDLVLRCCRCSWPAWGEAEAAMWNAVSQYYSTLLYPHPLALSPAGGVGPGHGAPPGSPARQQCAHHQLGPGKWYSRACVGMCVRGRGGGGACASSAWTRKVPGQGCVGMCGRPPRDEDRAGRGPRRDEKMWQGCVRAGRCSAALRVEG